MPYTVEPTSGEHLPGLRSALNTLLGERCYFVKFQGFTLDKVREFRKSPVESGGVQLVALDGSALVGWCDIRRRPEEGTRHVGVVGIGVLSGHRRRGLGPSLLDRAVDDDADLGVSRVELEVFASNTHAIHIYRKAGFESEVIKLRARILDGQADDLVCMARCL